MLFWWYSSKERLYLWLFPWGETSQVSPEHCGCQHCRPGWISWWWLSESHRVSIPLNTRLQHSASRETMEEGHLFTLSILKLAGLPWKGNITQVTCNIMLLSLVILILYYSVNSKTLNSYYLLTIENKIDWLIVFIVQFQWFQMIICWLHILDMLYPVYPVMSDPISIRTFLVIYYPGLLYLIEWK